MATRDDFTEQSDPAERFAILACLHPYLVDDTYHMMKDHLSAIGPGSGRGRPCQMPAISSMTSRLILQFGMLYDELHGGKTQEDLTQFAEKLLSVRFGHEICMELKKNTVENETVGVCAEPGINLPSTLLGIMKASSAYFPFGQDGAGFVKQSLAKLGVKHLLLDVSSFQRLRPMLLNFQFTVLQSTELQYLGFYLVRLQSLAGGEEHVQHVSGLAYCITTSGTTGTPKIVRVPHSCIAPNVSDFRKHFKPAVGDITFLTSPLTFDPSAVELFITLSSGTAVLLVATAVKMSPDRLLTMLTVRHRVSILQITPSLFRRFNPNTVKRTLLGPDSRLRVLAFGGETFLRKEVFDDCMHPENGTTVYNVYGITELSCWAALYCARLPKRSVQYPVPIGEALTGTKVKVVDDKGEDVTCGTGHILIGGAERICLLNNEDEDLLRRGNVWRRTGDLGKVESDANIICLGREDRQVKRNGKRLDLDTLEKVCREVDTVEDCHAVYTEATLHMFVRVKEHEKEEKKQLCNRVKSHVLETLPSQYQPDCLTLVTEFPVNSHGKLNASELLKLHGNDGTENQQPLSSAESWASKLWQDATCSWNKVPSPTDQFLLCGGDSLRAVQMVEQIDLHLDHQVPDLLDILLTRTFGDVLSLLQQHAQEHKTKFREAETTLVMENSHSRYQKRKIEETRTSQRSHKSKRARSLIETRRELRKGRRDQKKTSRAMEDLVEAAKPLPCFLHKDSTSVGTKAAERRDSVSCLAELVDEDQPSMKLKVRKLNTSGSDLGTGIATTGEKQRQAVMSTETYTFEETEGDSQHVKVLPKFSRSVLPETSVQTKTASATLVCLSLEQKEQTPAAEKNRQQEITVRQEGIPSDTLNSSLAVNSDCTGMKEDSSDEDFVTSVGRANTCLLTSHSERTIPCKHCQNQECHCDHGRHRSKSMSNVVNHSNENDMSRLNDATRFISSTETAVEKSSVRLELQWAVNTGKCVDASPLVATTRHGKSIVYIGSHSHKFFAIDLKSGSVLWCTELGDRVEGSACLSPCGSQVVVGCYDSNIYMLSADTGKIEWQVKTGDVVKCSPVADSSSHLVFCGSHDGFLYALHCKYQSVMWKCSAGGGSVFACPALSDDSSTVFAATLGGRITAMSVTTGKVLWSVSVGKPVFSSPTVHADRLCVGCVDSTLYCLSCATGDQMWTFKADAPIFSSPVVTKSTRSGQQCILFGCHDNNLYCVSESGQVLWRTMTSSTVYASPFVFCLCGRVTTGQKIEETVEEAAACSRTKHNVIEDKLVDSSTALQNLSQRQEREQHGFAKLCPAEEQEGEQHSFTKHCPAEEQEGEQHSFAKHCPAEMQQARDDSQALKGNCTTPQSIGETSDSGMQSDAILTAIRSHDVATSRCRKLVACGSTKGVVAILCCETGEKLGSIELPGDVFSSPVVVGDRLVVGCRDDSVYCYKVTVSRV